MFSLKPLVGLLLGGFLVVSCAPLPPVMPPPAPAGPDSAEALPVEEEMTPQQRLEEKKKLERIKANEEARKRREALAKERVDPVKPKPREPIKPQSKYRSAMAIPGKPGFVFNPWTNKSVDVRGIPSGTLIRDPNDGNPDHKFRVP